MKSVQLQLLVALTTLGLSAPFRASVGAVQESAQMAASIAQEVAELELSWKSGIGTAEFEYYARAGQIADNLFRHEPLAANAAAAELLSNLLTKRADPFEVREADFEVGSADLTAMGKVARYLLAEGNVRNGPQLQRIGLFAELLGTIRAEMVPDYVPKQVFANVLPAPLPGPGDPEAIVEKYKAAVRENSLNNLTNKRQRRLREMETEFAKPIVEYISRVAADDGAPRDIVHQAVLDARLTSLENTEVTQALKR